MEHGVDDSKQSSHVELSDSIRDFAAFMTKRAEALEIRSQKIDELVDLQAIEKEFRLVQLSISAVQYQASQLSKQLRASRKEASDDVSYGSLGQASFEHFCTVLIRVQKRSDKGQGIRNLADLRRELTDTGKRVDSIVKGAQRYVSAILKKDVPSKDFMGAFWEVEAIVRPLILGTHMSK